MSEVYVVTFTSADSYLSHKTYPHRVIYRQFEEAKHYAEQQPGYGFGKDWNVEGWELK